MENCSLKPNSWNQTWINKFCNMFTWATGALATVSNFFRTLFISSFGKPYALKTKYIFIKKNGAWNKNFLETRSTWRVKDQPLKTQTEPQNHKSNSCQIRSSGKKNLVDFYSTCNCKQILFRFVFCKIN